MLNAFRHSACGRIEFLDRQYFGVHVRLNSDWNIGIMSAATASANVKKEMKLEFESSGCSGDGQISVATLYEDCPYFGEAFDAPQAVRDLKLLLDEEGNALRKAAYCFSKRILDIVISLAAIVLLAPIFLLAAVMIKLNDRGSVFFTQERVGKGGRIFRCFKFRSMMLNAESLQQGLMDKSQHADPRTFKIADDPRITRPGKFLRRFSIDELPQVFDVLMGHMSIVGPRPPLPHEVQLYTDSDFQRLAVKPGLTCLWQVSGRSRLPFPEQVKLDVNYIQRRSLLLDLAIIVRTVPAVLSGDGAV